MPAVGVDPGERVQAVDRLAEHAGGQAVDLGVREDLLPLVQVVAEQRALGGVRVAAGQVGYHVAQEVSLAGGVRLVGERTRTGRRGGWSARLGGEASPGFWPPIPELGGARRTLRPSGALFRRARRRRPTQGRPGCATAHGRPATAIGDSGRPDRVAAVAQANKPGTRHDRRDGHRDGAGDHIGPHRVRGGPLGEPVVPEEQAGQWCPTPVGPVTRAEGEVLALFATQADLVAVGE
ncbi:hypothetical protein GCM10023321_50510 [Pseudonocardia eucalypti]|uniref:Uncharacterized protein n=1 Tax=Pseudonocardia eucalypti TaxID=648755 RepID=A0ABP9QKJ9_9PSEU